VRTGSRSASSKPGRRHAGSGDDALNAKDNFCCLRRQGCRIAGIAVIWRRPPSLDQVPVNRNFRPEVSQFRSKQSDRADLRESIEQECEPFASSDIAGVPLTGRCASLVFDPEPLRLDRIAALLADASLAGRGTLLGSLRQLSRAARPCGLRGNAKLNMVWCLAAANAQEGPPSFGRSEQGKSRARILFRTSDQRDSRGLPLACGYGSERKAV
jgi:hypothetical protein